MNQFKFSNNAAIEKLMFKTLIINIAATWVPLIILNIVGMLVLQWGTQLYIMMIENVILGILCITVGIIEHYRMVKHWNTQSVISIKSNKINASL